MNSAVTSNIGLLICAAGLFGSPSMDAHARDAGDGNTSETANLDTSVSLDIPAQSVETALFELSKQAAFQLLISDAIPPRRASRVVGKMSIKQALDLLLQGTNLGYKWIGERTLAVVSSDQTQPATDQNSTDAGRSPGAGADLTRASLAPSSASRLAAASVESAEGKLTTGLEEIIVTAQKREQRLIDVPQAVTVLSAGDLAKLAATQFRDFADTIPGLSYQTTGAGLNQITLRGLTAGVDVSRTVAIYVDEVPYGSSTGFARGGHIAFDGALSEVDRIEVLRGPQGTLYGASSMGGLIKYVTKRPDTTSFGAEARAGIASIQHGGVSFDTAAALNMPIVADKVALRVSGFKTHGGGYTDNVALGKKDVDSSDMYGGRADLLLALSDALSIRITGFLQNISSDGFPVAGYTLAGVPVDGSLQARRAFEEPGEQRFRLLSGTVGYDFGWAALTSISAYQTSRTHFVLDFSTFMPNVRARNLPISAVALDDESLTDKFTQEVRLASASNQRLEWLIGAFYTEEDSASDQFVPSLDLAGQPATLDILTSLQPTRYEEASAFGNLTWHLTDALDVTAGMRYSRNDQQYSQSGSGIFGQSRPLNTATDDVSTYLANARYRFSNHAVAYLRYATGYRPGGPNALRNDPLTGLPLANPTYAADEVKSYEVGYKGETVDRRFGLDAAVYHIDWNNIQVSAIRNGFGTRVNAPGGASVQGAELTLTARPTGAFTLAGAFAYQNGTLSEANTDLRAAKGERLPGVPRVTAVLNADYALPWARWQPTVGGMVRYVGDQRYSFNRSTSPPQYHFPDYVAVNLRAGFTLGSVTTQLYIHNLFDERGQLPSRVTLVPSTGPMLVSMLQPRTFGIAASTKF